MADWNFPNPLDLFRSSNPFAEHKMVPLHKLDQKEFVECLREMQEHRWVSPARQQLHNSIRSFVAKNIAIKNENHVASGAFKTSWGHVVGVQTPNAILPPGWVMLTENQMIDRIISESLQHGVQPWTPKPVNAFTLQDLLNGTPPASLDPPLSAQYIPWGFDRYNNPAVMLPSGHHGVEEFTDRVKQTHEEFSCGTDDWAPMRATWMCVLMQKDPTELANLLNVLFPHDKTGAVARVVSLATAYRKDGLDAISGILNDQSAHAGLEEVRLVYPCGDDDTPPLDSGGKEFDCEKELKALTKALLGTVKDGNGRALLAMNKKGAASHSAQIFSLLNILKVSGAIIGNDKGQLAEDADDTTTSVAMHSSDMVRLATAMSEPHWKPGEAGAVMHEWNSDKPVMERDAKGEYFLWIPPAEAPPAR